MDLHRLFSENFSSEKMLVWMLLLVIGVVWLSTLFEILTSKFKGKGKPVWGTVVFVLPGLGAILYLLFGRSSKINERRFTPF